MAVDGIGSIFSDKEFRKGIDKELKILGEE